ncbi:FOG: Transposon-encoded proteins with TYA, reverse transcriptase, integrase domains in various combinations [Ceraceosorus bombacis]|uniref:FOG: Transposon-encoded proteins with TYA, reverse transcriptase, integrase domains in various combinations n=1 Tax=Ceraceosorus bombacis TaxID=401625 RepID=A0A0P1BF57_9BASI|nr:FOG: Transposon-encoded proteins with TYA, reverse transcriptase, integrase domains in various combinations [Ceraceosorus bombacis]
MPGLERVDRKKAGPSTNTPSHCPIESPLHLPHNELWYTKLLTPSCLCADTMNLDLEYVTSASEAAAGSSSSWRLPKLTNNYANWARLVRFALVDKQLWGFIDGTEKFPDRDTCTVSESVPAAEVRDEQGEVINKGEKNRLVRKPNPDELALIVLKWRKDDNHVRHILATTLSGSDLAAATDTETARQLWDVIKARHQGAGLLIQVRAKANFYKSERARSKKLDTYVDRVHEDYRQLVSMGVNVKDEDCIAVLISGMGDEYRSLIQAFNSRRLEDLKLVDVEALLRDQAGLDAHHKKTLTNDLVLAATDGNADHRPKCTHCRRTGHTVKRCFLKFPELRPAGKRKEPPTPTATTTAAEMRQPTRFGMAFSAQVPQEDFGDGSATEDTTDPVEFSFLNIVCAPTVSSPSKVAQTRIACVDSGATSHVCNKESMLHNIRPLKSPHPVVVGDGAVVNVGYVGTLFLRPWISDEVLEVRNVLYDARFSGTLLSHGLIGDAGFEIRTYSDECRIYTDSRHGRSSRLVITGVREKSGDRLYYLDADIVPPPQPSMLNATMDQDTNTALWHARVGHLGPETMRRFTSVNDNCNMSYTPSQIPCNICQDAKNIRLPFGKEGLGRKEAVLERVHCDLGSINESLSPPQVGSPTGIQGLAPSDRNQAQRKTQGVPFRQRRNFDASRLRVWGCRASVLDDQPGRSFTLAPPGLAAVFVGYAPSHHAYRFWIPSQRKIIISRNATFNEFVVPDAVPLITGTPSIPQPIPKRPADDGAASSDDEEILEVRREDDNGNVQSVDFHNDKPPNPPPPARPSRQIRPPAWTRNYVPSAARTLVDIDRVNAIGDVLVPKTYEEALRSPQREEWVQAMDNEVQSLIDGQVFTSETDHPDARITGTKWVYALKIGEHGEILRFKARVVAKGYLQTEGVDRLR